MIAGPLVVSAVERRPDDAGRPASAVVNMIRSRRVGGVIVLT